MDTTAATMHPAEEYLRNEQNPPFLFNEYHFNSIYIFHRFHFGDDYLNILQM